MTVLFRSLAFLICGLVVVQLVLYLAKAMMRFVDEVVLRRLRIEKLRADIAVLRTKHEKQRREVTGWDGLRKFRVVKKQQECADCHSFYLVPHDGKSLPAFLPGQYLTIHLRVPGHKKPVVRCYSLSDRYDERYYRCTIKKMLAPGDAMPGLASTYFNEVIQEGDILDVKAPRGNFYLHQDRDTPVILLAGGVGITPLMSMARSLLAAGSTRQVSLFACFTSSQHHLFRKELQAMAAEYPSFELIVFYSNPSPSDELGQDYHVEDRIDIGQVQARLPSSHGDFYLCGPPSFMSSLTDGLSAWGVPDERVHTEAFGPSSVRKVATATAPVAVGAGVGGSLERPCLDDQAIDVQFDRSGKQAEWNPTYDSLLEFAEAHGIEIESGCRAGSCLTCLTAVKSGKVRYAEGVDADCDEGTCLPCIAIPDESIILDA